jgi:hypothetical protein
MAHLGPAAFGWNWPERDRQVLGILNRMRHIGYGPAARALLFTKRTTCLTDEQARHPMPPMRPKPTSTQTYSLPPSYHRMRVQIGCDYRAGKTGSKRFVSFRFARHRVMEMVLFGHLHLLQEVPPRVFLITRRGPQPAPARAVPWHLQCCHGYQS